MRPPAQATMATRSNSLPSAEFDQSVGLGLVVGGGEVRTVAHHSSTPPSHPNRASAGVHQ
jgi:hypothetical protein